MKTKVITGLKKEVLVIELPEETYYEVFKHGILFKDHLESEREFIEGTYTLLGKPDEIKEEDVRSLVSDFDAFENSKYYYLHGFWKLIEKEIYWVNPNRDIKSSVLDMTLGMWEIKKRFLEAQEKTFDKNRTLIFIKK